MLRAFFLDKKWRLWAWGGLLLLCVLIVIEVWLQVQINDWYRKTYDLLQTPDIEKMDDFWNLIVLFGMIATPYILLRTFSIFFSRHYTFRWRQAMTFAYMPLWSLVEKEVEGASQRLQEDTQRFAATVESLLLEVFRSVLTLIAFLPVLWAISDEITTAYNESSAEILTHPSLAGIKVMAQIPGALCWLALLLALIGTGLSFIVGIKLPGLNYNNQKVEAKFRKQLVYSEDDKQYANIETVGELFTGLRWNYFRLFRHYTYFNMWENMFFQTLIIADLLIIGPGVIVGVVTLGLLTQISHSFGKVSSSLAFFIDRWPQITELQSIIKRLREFEINIGYRQGANQEVTGEQVQVINKS